MATKPGTLKAKPLGTKRLHDPERSRGTSSQRGYNRRWVKARAVFLTYNPLCKHCQSKRQLTPAKVVDHVVPHKGDYDLFWDESNWQALCKRHHDIKTAREDGGFGNRLGGRG